MTPDPRESGPRLPQWLTPGVAVWLRHGRGPADAAVVVRVERDGSVLIRGQSSGRVPHVSLSPRAYRLRGCGAKNARGPLPPSKRDPLAECQRFHGTMFRHKFTGQLRTVFIDQGRRRVAFGQPSTWTDFEREPRKALEWLRNAVEVA